jgi:hypothetical protein
MSLVPFFPKQLVRIEKNELEFVELDVSENESHNWDSVLTTNPVEAGADVTDHKRTLPRQLKISGVLSNTPLTLTGVSLDPTRGDDALGTLRIWQEDAEMLTIVTSLVPYESMQLKTISVMRNKEKARNVFVDLTFEEVTLAGTKFAAVVEPVTERVQAKPKKNLGKQAGKEKRTSVLRKGLKKLGI